MMRLEPRQRDLLRLLWREGRLSRWEMHLRTGVNPNAVGVDIGGLLDQRIVRECERAPVGPGRPPIPVEIDEAKRNVVGLAVTRKTVEIGRLSLRGQLIGGIERVEIAEIDNVVAGAAKLLGRTLDKDTLGIGVSTPGFVDPQARAIMAGPVFRSAGPTSLEPLLAACDDTSTTVANDMHAMAARWLLTHQPESQDDVLLVSFGDRHLGAAMLIEGRPNRGCAIGANELGHSRFPVETDVCHCGHQGCIEQIYSTNYLRRLGGGSETLEQRIQRYDGTDEPLNQITKYVATVLSNAVQFMRPQRLVLVSKLLRHERYNNDLLAQVRAGIMKPMDERINVSLWDAPATEPAETAGWLALASLYRDGWHHPEMVG